MLIFLRQSPGFLLDLRLFVVRINLGFAAVWQFAAGLNLARLVIGVYCEADFDSIVASDFISDA